MSIINNNTANRATQLLMRYESYISKPKWDVNALRAGYGSDTVTRADGSVSRVVKGMTVSKEDAARDLARRIPIFANIVASQVGLQNWQRLPDHVQAALLSTAYNYGGFTKLKGVKNAIKSGNIQNIANSISSLKGHNNGINSKRRLSEANYILTGAQQGATPPSQSYQTSSRQMSSGQKPSFTPPKVMQGFDKLIAKSQPLLVSTFEPPKLQQGFDKLIAETTTTAPTFTPPQIMQGFDKLVAQSPAASNNSFTVQGGEQDTGQTPPTMANDTMPMNMPITNASPQEQMATAPPQTQGQMGLDMPAINAQAIFPQILANATDLQNNRLVMA